MVKTSPSNAGGVGLIPDRGAKIPHALGPKNRNIKQKQYCNKFNKGFKNGPCQKILKKKKYIGFRVRPIWVQISELPDYFWGRKGLL